jgi:cytochrome c553
VHRLPRHPGYQASFPEVHKVPMISGQGAKYIAASLVAYKKGDRKHPTMRAIAASLTEQDMADLGAFYESKARADMVKTAPAALAKPSPEPEALLTKGNCASCHGANFSKPIDPAYPKPGRPACRLPVRGAEGLPDRWQPQGRPQQRHHGGQVKQFKLAELKAELKQKYLASLPGDLQTVPQSRFR